MYHGAPGKLLCVKSLGCHTHHHTYASTHSHAPTRGGYRHGARWRTRTDAAEQMISLDAVRVADAHELVWYTCAPMHHACHADQALRLHDCRIKWITAALAGDSGSWSAAAIAA